MQKKPGTMPRFKLKQIQDVDVKPTEKQNRQRQSY